MILVLFVIALTAAAAPLDPIYTEDLAVFKDKAYNARLEAVAGCWLMVKEYVAAKPLDRESSLRLTKQCMKRISRKDSVLKITAMIGKNQEPAKQLQQILSPESILASNLPNSPSDFDEFLQKQIDSYELELKEFDRSKFQGDEFQKRVEEQLKKREKKYFGIIPANQFTHTVGMITISLLVMLLCTCWKYAKKREGLNKTKKGQKKTQARLPQKKNS